MLQAQRLGAHLYARVDDGGRLAHIFSSDLQRAFKTAEAIRDAQSRAPAVPVAVVKTADLREKDFRSSEGKSFRSRRDGVPPQASQDGPETTQEMRIRAERFIASYLEPIFAAEGAAASGHAVVIVAHGLILGVLLKAILAKYSPAELLRLSGLGGGGNSEYLVAWSNTGYLEASVEPKAEQDSVSMVNDTAQQQWRGLITVAVKVINCKDHLQGLQRTRGGIGSAKFDEKQKTMDSFFAASKTKTTGGDPETDQ